MTSKPETTCKLEFRDLVYRAIKTVPAGWVTTYGDVAVAAGSPRAARQVGFALSRLSPEEAKLVPWHRVINSQGAISLRGDLIRGGKQRILLEKEGIQFNQNGRVALAKIRWHYPEWLDL